MSSKASRQCRRRWFRDGPRPFSTVVISSDLYHVHFAAGQLSFGILESYQKTLLAIVTSIAMEMALGAGCWENGRILPAHISRASASVS